MGGMKKLALLALVSLLGCGGGSEHCQPRVAGNYQIAVTPLSPNGCGLEAGLLVSTTSEPFPACNGTTENTASMCTASFSKTCQNDDGSTATNVGYLDWNSPGTHGDGVLTYQHHLASGAVDCTSTVMLEYTKI